MKHLHPVWTAGMQEPSYIKLFVLHGDETPTENRLLCREGLIYASLYEMEWKQPTEEFEYWALSVCKSEFKLLMFILLFCFSNCPGEKKSNNWALFHTKYVFWIAISWQKKKKKEEKAGTQPTQPCKSLMRMEASGRCKSQHGIYLD